MKQPEIDFVVLWVDPNDPAWQEEKAKYHPQTGTDSSVVRYQNWENFRYWFRAVARYAPWVNRIHVVTCGQVPEWLNVNHPKIHLVNHSDYMPSEALPTFNSNAIEMGIHRISGVAELFVLFNDDEFLSAPIEPDFYFCNGIPVDMPGFIKPPCKIPGKAFSSSLFNNSQVLQKYFTKKDILKGKLHHWLNPVYGKTCLRTMRWLYVKKLPGFIMPHLSVPYLKSDFQKVWEKEADILQQTQRHRFRSEADVTHFLFRNWRMCEGAYIPRKSLGKYFSIDGPQSAEAAAKAIRTSRYPEICINEVCTGESFEQAKKIINQAFAETLEDTCEFETKE